MTADVRWAADSSVAPWRVALWTGAIHPQTSTPPLRGRGCPAQGGCMTNEAILERVRKLLAKAEHPGTPAAEAEAFSVKAAALIARYAIDEALLAERGPDAGAPVLRTLTVDAPYALAKSVLLSQVAGAHRVRV